jgi:hypothetical protein
LKEFREEQIMGHSAGRCFGRVRIGQTEPRINRAV